MLEKLTLGKRGTKSLKSRDKRANHAAGGNHFLEKIW